MKIKYYGLSQIDNIPQLNRLSQEQQFETKAVAHVLPFRVNNYVLDELIDWNDIPNDPIFQLTFMQKKMLSSSHFQKIASALRHKTDKAELNKVVGEIRQDLNPHPAGQLSANVPELDNESVQGLQHKYEKTCLVFPSSGQTCFSYCTFCFRWAQFVGDKGLKFATDESNRFLDYIKSHMEISDVLVTGGDPIIMSAKRMSLYLEPLLQPEFEHISNIRIGTKVLAYWPYRFLSDKDADDYLRLFEKLSKAGKHLAFMAHFNHPRELELPAVQKAISRLRSTGLQIRTQSPVLKHINNSAKVWADMWTKQVNLGLLPYYMFVERDTGPKKYFEIPLVEAHSIYKSAQEQISGLARTARGPSMSCLPGKVSIEGVSEIRGQKVFVLTMIQGRRNDWVRRPFFAKYDPEASWLDDLTPAFGDSEFFYEEELRQLLDPGSTMDEKKSA